MAKLLVTDLVSRLLDDELSAENQEITYYAVTDPNLFLAGLDKLCELKGDPQLTQPLKGRFESLKKVFDSTRAPSTFYIGNNYQNGRVEVISFPVIEARYLGGTVFAGSKRLVILRSDRRIFPGSHEEAKKTVTGADLETLTINGSGLYKIKDLLVESYGGTDLLAVENLILKNEVDLPLQRLRNCYEYAMGAWIKLSFKLNGMRLKDTKRPYKDVARAFGILSESDFRQAEALVFAGNAAVHHDFTIYSGLHAALFLHWLSDFVDRTIGFHRLPKSRVNEDLRGDIYRFITDDTDFKIRRALLDSLQAHKNLEQNDPAIFDNLPSKETTIRKEYIMEAAAYVMEVLGTKTQLEKGEQRYAEALNYWFKELRNGGTNSFTARDAVRAAVFAYNLFRFSKPTDVSRLSGTEIWEELDPNYLKAVKKKGRAIRRYDMLHFDELVRDNETLAAHLELLNDVIEAQPEYLRYKAKS